MASTPTVTRILGATGKQRHHRRRRATCGRHTAGAAPIAAMISRAQQAAEYRPILARPFKSVSIKYLLITSKANLTVFWNDLIAIEIL